jgi:hypothetical protein
MRCYVSSPAKEFDPFGDWKWFLDEAMKHPLTEADLDKLRSGDLEMAYTRHFHDEHCLYNWRKLAIAVEEKRAMIDSLSAQLHHSAHCVRSIASFIAGAFDSTIDVSHTESPLMFQNCTTLAWKQCLEREERFSF